MAVCSTYKVFHTIYTYCLESKQRKVEKRSDKSIPRFTEVSIKKIKCEVMDRIQQQHTLPWFTVKKSNSVFIYCCQEYLSCLGNTIHWSWATRVILTEIKTCNLCVQKKNQQISGRISETCFSTVQCTHCIYNGWIFHSFIFCNHVPKWKLAAYSMTGGAHTLMSALTYICMENKI